MNEDKLRQFIIKWLKPLDEFAADAFYRELDEVFA